MKADTAKLRDLLAKREQARRDGLPGRVLEHDMELALAAPALLDTIAALRAALLQAKDHLGRHETAAATLTIIGALQDSNQ